VQVAQDAIASCFDTEPPTFLYQPWSFSDPDALEALLAEAGFTSLSLQLVSRTNEGSTARQIARGFVRGTPTIQAVQERALAPVDAVVETVARALSEAFGCALDAPLQVPMQALVATARRAD